MSEEPEFVPPKDRWWAVLAFVGTIVCLGMCLFELSRAVDGNDRSMAYAIEWPLFGGFAIYMWRRYHRVAAQESEEQDSPVEPSSQ